MIRLPFRIGFLAAALTLFIVFASSANALVYTKNSFPTSSGQVITCDGNDIRISCQDSGDGRNHFCSTFGLNGCRAVEGRNNYGSPGCLITCQKEEKCSDGTPNGQCSVTNPFYCESNVLVRRATLCGCVSPKVRSGDECIDLPKCNDGTAFGQCSPTRPLFCNNGVLINRASQCGCPSGQTASGDNCVAQQQTCTDGTLFGQCSVTRPLFCNNGVLTNLASTCGCPSGQTSSGDNCVPIISGQQASNKLSITDIDAKVDGKSSSNIANNGEISKEAKPDSDIELEIEIKNIFTSAEDIDIDDIEVRASIEGISDGSDLEEESESFDLRADADKTVRFKFKVPLNVEEGTYNIFIEAEGEDENGTSHKDDADIDLDVEKEPHDLRFAGFDLFPKIVGCSRDINANARIINIGESDEENAFVELESSGLGIDIKSPFDVKSDAEANVATKNFRLKISDSIEDGTYRLNANLLSEDGKIRDQRAADISVEGCGSSQIGSSDVVLQMSAPPQAKGNATMPLLSISFEGLDAKLLMLLLALLIIVLFVFVIIFALAEGEEKTDEEYY
ncbi:hypothetical protein HYX07_04255 [Candidatus Woesearchaeota archaeon]|nr:hypothetical protein [Candidatus Woesearchaeota archaeon]